MLKGGPSQDGLFLFADWIADFNGSHGLRAFAPVTAARPSLRQAQGPGAWPPTQHPTPNA